MFLTFFGVMPLSAIKMCSSRVRRVYSNWPRSDSLSFFSGFHPIWILILYSNMNQCCCFLLVLLSFFGEIVQSASETEDCADLFSSKAKPRACCDFPHRTIPESIQKKCKKACDNIEDKTGGCCVINCNYHKTGVVIDSKFSDKALLELYENYLTEKGAGKFDQWLPIVAKSIETCSRLCLFL
jgi:hypothetical protein